MLSWQGSDSTVVEHVVSLTGDALRMICLVLLRIIDKLHACNTNRRMCNSFKVSDMDQWVPLVSEILVLGKKAF